MIMGRYVIPFPLNFYVLYRKLIVQISRWNGKSKTSGTVEIFYMRTRDLVARVLACMASTVTLKYAVFPPYAYALAFKFTLKGGSLGR